MTDLVVQWIRGGVELDFLTGTVLAGIFITTGLLPIPRTVLCLAAGAVYGVAAILIILPSTTVASVIGFILARYFLAGWLSREVEMRPKLRAVMTAIEDESWRIVGLFRFSSPVPTTVQNYLFGVTGIGLLPFTLATFFFTIPQVSLYVYLGAAGRTILIENSSSRLSYALVVVGATTLAVAVALVIRRIRNSVFAASLQGVDDCRSGQIVTGT